MDKKKLTIEIDQNNQDENHFCQKLKMMMTFW